jgi:phosphopantetheinyl transferase (holo-ACP synthase)
VSVRGIGVDAEQVSRFEKFAAGERPWRLVYSEREGSHLAAQPQAAQAFCAAFCCKEALYKALGEFYSFPQFECLYRSGVPEQEFVLAPGLKERLGIGEVRVRIDEQFLGERGEFVVEVHLIGRSAPQFGYSAPCLETPPVGHPESYLETLQVAAVESERGRIEAEHFSPAEVAALGGRRAQSVAGALALKQALVRVWAGASAPVAATPRDFELGHHENGAPRLVAAPAGVALADVSVSISHTRQWAYGLAAASL